MRRGLPCHLREVTGQPLGLPMFKGQCWGSSAPGRVGQDSRTAFSLGCCTGRMGRGTTNPDNHEERPAFLGAQPAVWPAKGKHG